MYSNIYSLFNRENKFAIISLNVLLLVLQIPLPKTGENP